MSIGLGGFAMAKGSGVKKTALVPGHARGLTLFGPPPLIEGENAAAYVELLNRISAAVKPRDILEEIWVRDVVDLVWEGLRWRRLKSNLLAASTHAGLKKVLDPLCGYIEADRLAGSWARNEAAGRKEVKQVLASAGLSMDVVMAQTLSLKINDIERIDRMVMAAEARRDATLREIERHRATLGQALRRETEQVEEGEFEEVDAPKLAANLS
jgi:hypothetical protein